MLNIRFYTILLVGFTLSMAVSAIGQGTEKNNSNDSLKYYDYSLNKKNGPYGPGNHLILTDPTTGKIIFDEREQVHNLALYNKFADEADLMLSEKKISIAKMTYETALKVNMNQAKVKHRLNLAKCYAMLDMKDSAFVQLNRVANHSNFYDYKMVEAESMYKSLMKDDRWKAIIDKLKEKASKIKNVLDENLPYNIEH